MIVILIILTLLILTIVLSLAYIEEVQDQRFFESFVYDSESLNVDEFFEFYDYKSYFSRKTIHHKYDGPGVYVLYNYDLKKYYIEQSEQVIEAIYQQLDGELYSSVQAEIDEENRFDIKMMLLEETPYRSLNELESETKQEFLAL